MDYSTERKNNHEPKKIIGIPLAIALFGVIMIIAAFFLPYASAKTVYGKWLSDNADGMFAEEIGMTNGEAIGISLLEYLRIYIYSASNYSESEQIMSIICIVVISLMVVFTLLCTLFSVLKKPIPLIVFDILMFITLLLMNYIEYKAFIAYSRRYDWGVAYYLYFIGIAIILVGAVWLIISKNKIKRLTENTKNDFI